jgi:hypothetical protein
MPAHRYYISESADGQTWVCPRCPDHETYIRLGTGDIPKRFVDIATAMCRKEFGVEDDGLSTVVWLGERPESVFEKALDAYHIYLSRNSDKWQLMYSGAHEAFHRVCTPPESFHWAHEMLAVHFSLTFLDRIYESAHAAGNRRSLSHEATRCSLEQLLASNSVPFPDGFWAAHTS